MSSLVRDLEQIRIDVRMIKGIHTWTWIDNTTKSFKELCKRYIEGELK